MEVVAFFLYLLAPYLACLPSASADTTEYAVVPTIPGDTVCHLDDYCRSYKTTVCHAQCVTLCEDLKFGIGPAGPTVNKSFQSSASTAPVTSSSTSSKEEGFEHETSPADEECLEECVFFSSTDWIADCGDDVCCVYTCMYMRDMVDVPCDNQESGKNISVEVDTPEIEGGLDLEETSPPYVITLRWPQAETRSSANYTIIYMVEHRQTTDWSIPQWNLLSQTKNTYQVVEVEACCTESYRVAAVNQFGTSGFTNSTRRDPLIKRNQLGVVTNVWTEDQLKLIQADDQHAYNYYYYSFTFSTPAGWREEDIKKYEFEEFFDYRCQVVGPPPPIPRVTIVIDEHRKPRHFVSIEIPETNSYMCVFWSQLYAYAECNEQEVRGQPYTVTVDITDCSVIEGQDCPYIEPNDVDNVTTKVHDPPVNNTVSVYWEEPALNSASYIATYIVQWGIVNEVDFANIVIVIMVEEEDRVIVPGDMNSVDIQVVNTGQKYGVKVVAVPPPYENNLTQEEVEVWVEGADVMDVFEIPAEVQETSLPTKSHDVSTSGGGDVSSDDSGTAPSTASSISGGGDIGSGGGGSVEDKHYKDDPQVELNIIVPLCVGAIIIIVIVVIILAVYHRRTKARAATDTQPWDLGEDTTNYKTFMLQRQVDGCLIDNPFYVAQSDSKPPVLDEWEVPRACLVLGEVLGVGAFGQVVRGTMDTKYLRHRVRGKMSITSCSSVESSGEQASQQPDEITVAVKMLLGYSEETYKYDFLKEIDLMKTIGPHPHIVSIIGCCTITEPLCLIVEHASHGDLLHYLRQHRQLITEGESTPGIDGRLSLQDLLSFARQITVGMEFLSQKGFVHRDLATRNILIGDAKTVKIGDFGLTRYIYDDKVYVTRKGGKLPLKWMAIEAIFDLTFTSASDVWAFGVVVFELITLGGTPYPTIANKDLLRELKAGYRMEKPDNCRPELYQLMCDCWEERPANRPSFTSLRTQLELMLETHSSAEYLNFDCNASQDYYRSTTDDDEVFQGLSSPPSSSDSGAQSCSSESPGDKQEQLAEGITSTRASASSGIVVDCRRLNLSVSSEDSSSLTPLCHVDDKTENTSTSCHGKSRDSSMRMSTCSGDGLLPASPNLDGIAAPGWIGETEL